MDCSLRIEEGGFSEGGGGGGLVDLWTCGLDFRNYAGFGLTMARVLCPRKILLLWFALLWFASAPFLDALARKDCLRSER